MSHLGSCYRSDTVRGCTGSRIPRCLLFGLIVIFLSAPAHSLGFSLDAKLGHSSSSESDYRSGLAGDLSGSLETGRWYFRIGYTDLGELELRDSLSDTYIDISGAYLGIGHAVRFDWLDLELGGGAFFAQSEAHYGGSSVAKDRDVRPFLDARLVKPMTALISLQAGLRYFSDVSGSDLTVAQAGVRFSWGGDR